MWHEARRQEKILRTTMIDQSKRAERKRRYFENVRKDPEQFMQIHGRKAQVHADLSIARAAEDSNILRPWQGDSSITIDRFDARSHLSKMDLIDDDDIPTKKKQEAIDEKEKIVTDFERYRVLIINDYKKVSEKSYLKKIADREFYHSEKEHSKKAEAEKKKKSAEKKSQIGFSYDDSEVVKGGGKGDKNETDEESEEEEIDDMFDLDVDLDTSILNPETQRTVNKSGEEFGVKRGLFCALLKADQQALRDAAQLKQIDRQKAQLSGRDSKHERMLLRQQRQAIVGKKGMVVSENGATATLLGFINQSQKKSKIDEMMKDMEGSDDDDDRRAKPEFITTFGGNADRESDDEGKKHAVGPELPSEEYRKILKLSQNRRKDDDEKVDWGNLKLEGNDGMSRRSWSKSRSATRSRSPPGRNRSRSRDRYRHRRSGSRRRRSRSRDRRRSRSRDRRRSRSRDRRRSRSRDRRRGSSRTRYRSRSSSRRRYRSKDRRRDRSREDRNERRRRSKSKERKEEVKVPEKVPEEKQSIKIDEPKESSAEESGTEDVKMLEIRSSMSDSEKEKIEIENRKRRVKLTKKLIKEKRGQPSAADDRSSDEDDEEEQRKADEARRVKRQMSQALKKTRQEMIKEEEERKREAMVAQKVRDELRYIEVQERRERERAKQRQADIPLPPSNSP